MSNNAALEIDPTMVPYLTYVTGTIARGEQLMPGKDVFLQANCAQLKEVLKQRLAAELERTHYQPIRLEPPKLPRGSEWGFLSYRAFMILHELFTSKNVTYASIGRKWNISVTRVGQIVKTQARWWAHPIRYAGFFRIYFDVGRVSVTVRDLSTPIVVQPGSFHDKSPVTEHQFSSIGEALRFVDEWLAQLDECLRAPLLRCNGTSS